MPAADEPAAWAPVSAAAALPENMTTDVYKRQGDGLAQVLIMRYGDVFKGIGTFLGFLNGVGQPVGGILHHGKLDGQLLYLLKMVSGLIQGLGGVIKTIGQGQRLRFMLDPVSHTHLDVYKRQQWS